MEEKSRLHHAERIISNVDACQICDVQGTIRLICSGEGD